MEPWKAMVHNSVILYAVLSLSLLVGPTVSSSLILEQKLTQAPIRNGKGELCTFTATEAGRYQLSGLARRAWHQQFCTVFIRGPPHTRIRVTFDIDQLDCDKSLLNVYDGWRVFDWLKKKHYSLPDDSDTNETGPDQRQRNMCAQPRVGNQISGVQTSQNAGQIFYRLAHGDAVVANIEFIEDEQMCSVFISDKVDGLYKISNNGKAGVCKWYVSGSVIVTLDELHLLNSISDSCDSNGNFLLIQSSSLSWRVPDVRLESSFCNPEPVRLEHLLPCKYNRIELHTNEATDGEEQWATFTMQRPSEMEKEPFTYYCL